MRDACTHCDSSLIHFEVGDLEPDHEVYYGKAWRILIRIGGLTIPLFFPMGPRYVMPPTVVYFDKFHMEEIHGKLKQAQISYYHTKFEEKKGAP